MKSFILKSVVFLSLAVLVIGGACALEIGAEIVHYRRELKASPEATVLVCGDSRTEVALNPEFWPELFNFSVSARPLDQSYLTVCDVLAANPGRFKTLLIDLSPESAAIDLDLPMGKMNHGSKCVLLYFLHPRSGLRKWAGALGLLRDNLVDRRLRLVSRVLRGKRTFHSSLASGFHPFDEQFKVNCPEKFEASINRIVDFTCGVLGGTVPLSNYFQAVDRLVSLARVHGLEPVLLTMPWHPDLIRSADPEKVRWFTIQVEEFARKTGCRYHNLMEARFPDGEWRDSNHLNRIGATGITQLLRQLVENGQGAP